MKYFYATTINKSLGIGRHIVEFESFADMVIYFYKHEVVILCSEELNYADALKISNAIL